MPTITQQDYIYIDVEEGLAYDEFGTWVAEHCADRLRACYKNGTIMDVIFRGRFNNMPWYSRICTCEGNAEDNMLYLYWYADAPLLLEIPLEA